MQSSKNNSYRGIDVYERRMCQEESLQSQHTVDTAF